jgi:hypothetical protein
VNCTDLEDAILQKLGHSKTLGSGKREVYFFCEAELKECEMLGPTDARDDEVKVVNLLRTDLDQGTRQEIGLLLVVSLHHDSVTRYYDRFKGFNDLSLC